MNTLAIDTETTGLNVWTGARPFAVSMCDDAERTYYWEWVLNPHTRRPKIRKRDVRQIRELALTPGVRKRFWNAKFDVLMLRSIGIDLTPCIERGEIDEVLFMARVVNNLELSYALKPLAKKYVEISDADEKMLHAAVVRCRRVAKKLGWPRAEKVQQDYWLPHTLKVLAPDSVPDNVDVEMCEEYAVTDAVRTHWLGEFYEYGMDELDVRHAYEDEMALWPTTLEMESHGVMIHEDRLEQCREDCENKIDKSVALLREVSGNDEFNINSTKQIVRLLFEGEPMSLPILKRTKKRQPSTGAEALAPHKGNEIVDALFTAKANTQAIKLFFGKYEALATRDDLGNMILHPGYHQCGTLTFRYTCSEPNLQQVSDPNTTNSLAAEYVVDVRQVFGPRPGYVWYCPDYDQVEVIIFADIAGEPALLDAIREGVDIHQATAEVIWGGSDNPRMERAFMELAGKDPGLARELMERHDYKITDAEKSVGVKVFRKRAKSVTFTKIFGGTALALMRWIQVDKPTAIRILSTYDQAFPTMVERMKEIENQGKADGYVINPFGIRLNVDPWYAYRIVNHVVQSSAAHLMKRGMRQSTAYLKDLGIDARLIMTIHDELVFEFWKKHAFKRVLRGIKTRMADHGGVFSIETPVSFDKVTTRWNEKTEVVL